MQGASRPQIWAHRGLGGTPLENTLDGFLEAIQLGAEGAELDVRPSRDGELVVFHDADLQRLVGRSDRVADLDLKTLRALSWADGRGRIPTLAEVAEAVCPVGTLNVELKPDVPSIDDAVRRLHQELTALPASSQDQIIVSSFYHPALDHLRRLGIPRVAPLLHLEQPAPATLLAGATAVHPAARHCSHAAVRAWHAQQLKVNVWTVNDPEEAASLAAMGVDALITDDIAAVRAGLLS